MRTTSIYYNRAFDSYLRNGGDRTSLTDLVEGYNESTDSYQFPQGFRGDYADALAKENLFRRLSTIVDVSNGDGKIQAVTSTAIAELVPEGAAFDEQSDTFSNITFKAYKLASLAKLYVNFVLDKDFELQQYLKTDFARRFGRREEQLLLNGTGVDQPTGLLTSAEVGKQMPELTYDSIIDLFFSLKPEYRKNAVWLVNDTTALALRKLKDDSGAYLWDQSSDTLLGRPVEYSMYIPDIAAGNKPIAFGDLSYYWLLQREPLYIKLLQEKYLLQGMLGFAAHERIDGKLVRPEAVKTLEITA